VSTLGSICTTLRTSSRYMTGPPLRVARSAEKKNGGVRSGSKADICNAPAHARFAPKSDINCDR
jgi:hypothetical protein